VSSLWSLTTALFVLLWVREPVRGAKEKVLQELLQLGNEYDRQLALGGDLRAIRQNRSNIILLWQGFFGSLPWGIVFVFLNDYLSQEKGFSVPDATFMVMLFGIGCAIGVICGGYIGEVGMRCNRSYLPLFMAASTFLGIFPFLGLLNSSFPDRHGYKAMVYSILGGCIASLPSVNIQPCIINANPPESRGTALTAANLVITLGRGIGPSCITIMRSFFHRSNPRLPQYRKPDLPVFGPASATTESPTCGTHLLDHYRHHPCPCCATGSEYLKILGSLKQCFHFLRFVVWAVIQRLLAT
jgi:predicted MFS family arabinose efflux permease